MAEEDPDQESTANSTLSRMLAETGGSPKGTASTHGRTCRPANH